MALLRLEPLTDDDVAQITAALDRFPRGAVGIAWRCPTGEPGVVATAPRLPDGTPFPTNLYLTCPHAVYAASRLESSHVMAEFNERLAADADLRDAHARAHADYLACREEIRARADIDEVPEVAGTSAGGMPTRVKCLHALVAHALARGTGVNVIGDEALAMMGEFWREGA